MHFNNEFVNQVEGGTVPLNTFLLVRKDLWKQLVKGPSSDIQ